MKYLLILFISFNLHALSLEYRINHLSEKQKIVMYRVIKLAEPHDLKWTMLAQVWWESDFGENLESKTNDFGWFQINLTSFKNRYNKELKKHPLSDKSIKNMLKTDHNLNFTCAVAEIEFWKNVHGYDWPKVWGSYNGGWVGNKNYASGIAKRIRILKSYLGGKQLEKHKPK